MQQHHGPTLSGSRSSRFQEAPAWISLRGARAAYVGPSLRLAPHRTAVAVLAVGLEAPFALRLFGADAQPSAATRQRAALIAPGRLHHLQAHGPMAFVYLDALSDDHAALTAQSLAGVADRLAGAVATARSVDDLCSGLGLEPKPATDPRAMAVLRGIEAAPDAYRSVAAAAQAMGLSPSRCRDLIRQAAGVPFRRYRLWRRMARVCQALAAGTSLTEAAHEAGFASSAHLSAAFRQMFGLAPSALIKAGLRIDVE